MNAGQDLGKVEEESGAYRDLEVIGETMAPMCWGPWREKPYLNSILTLNRLM